MEHNKLVLPCILNTFLELSSKNGKKYCYPSHSKILELLKEHYEIQMSEKTLCRYLRLAEADGYITRVRRFGRNDAGGLRFKSTLYFVKKKVYRLLFRFVSRFRWICTRVKARFWKTVHKPSDEPAPGDRYMTRDEVHAGIRELVGTILTGVNV